MCPYSGVERQRVMGAKKFFLDFVIQTQLLKRNQARKEKTSRLEETVIQ
jgi:hypothetical protein